nr:MAG TPA: hypothetical protein [Caudoviricetes sp.]
MILIPFHIVPVFLNKKSDKSPIHIGFYNLIYALIISEKK